MARNGHTNADINGPGRPGTKTVTGSVGNHRFPASNRYRSRPLCCKVAIFFDLPKLPVSSGERSGDRLSWMSSSSFKLCPIAALRRLTDGREK